MSGTRVQVKREKEKEVQSRILPPSSFPFGFVSRWGGTLNKCMYDSPSLVPVLLISSSPTECFTHSSRNFLSSTTHSLTHSLPSSFTSTSQAGEPVFTLCKYSWNKESDSNEVWSRVISPLDVQLSSDCLKAKIASQCVVCGVYLLPDFQPAAAAFSSPFPRDVRVKSAVQPPEPSSLTSSALKSHVYRRSWQQGLQ